MHSRTHNLRAVLLLACAPVLVASASPGAAADPEATEAAEAWLALVDAGEYHESWAEAGRTFQDALTAEEWTQHAANARQQVGQVVDREVSGTTPMTDPPGAPPGDYVQVLYRSKFSDAGAANEMVVLVNEADRGWRVVGYFVQPAEE